MKMKKLSVSKRLNCHICNGFLFLEDSLISNETALYTEFQCISERLSLWDIITVPFIYKSLLGHWHIVKAEGLEKIPYFRGVSKRKVCKFLCDQYGIGKKPCLDKETCLICLKDYVKIKSDRFSYFWNDYGVVYCYKFAMASDHTICNIVNIRGTIPDGCGFKLEHMVKTGIVKKNKD